ncbi:MAG: class I SAM-dependent methyltransferase [Bacteroidia bacterium]|nr:class I SAM-dependent methyltransferase [Bacteroidia bacterium]
MTDFNNAARSWDSNNIHAQRSEAIAKNLLARIEVQPEMKALEFGAGTGILSFMLADRFSSITMMDAASEMVAVMQEKVEAFPIKNLHPVLFDLTKEPYESETFDCVFTQMALHHVSDTQDILNRFFELLDKGGYLVVADLYSEDGSFHGEGFDGHNGFDAVELEEKMKKAGFLNVQTETCFTMQKMSPEGMKDFPIFLMIARN